MRRLCAYCRRFGWEWNGVEGPGRRNNGGIHAALCNCGKRHLCCDECWGARAKILGDFPHQSQRMPQCPHRRSKKA